MKQLMTLMILIAFATLISCDGVSTKTPEGAVKGFYNAISAMDFEKAESFVTKESKEVIGLLKGLKQMGDDEEIKELEGTKAKKVLSPPNGNFTFGINKKATNVKCEIDGDKAVCTICCDENGNFSAEKFNVHKVNVSWLVYLPETKIIEETVKGFYNAISAMDFEKAESFVTKESKEVIGLLKGLKQMGDDEAMKDIEDKKAEKVKCEIDGDKAECEVCCDEDGNFSDEKFNVKKVDGKWLVSISKEDMNKEDDMDMDFDMDMDEETDEE
ncbi:MAG: DUF4878 domain-containing protein [Saprospiraceae bacterium]|nr:DUF4878 domain-containing protein [Saprospiraceae bacterium]